MKKAKIVYYEVFAYGCGVIGQYDTLEKAKTEAVNTGLRTEITKVTKERITK